MAGENNPTLTIHRLLTRSPLLVKELGDALFVVLTGEKSVRNERINVTRVDCIQYVHSWIKGDYIRPLSVIYDGLAKRFPDVRFEKSPPELDHAGDVDYLGYVGERAFGIQIKPTTAKANFGNYSVSERMRASFAAFQEDFSGRVFIVFSLDGEIGNPEILPEIADEIARLRT